jgi:hypothetical protein
MVVTFNMVDYFLKKMSVTVIDYPAYYPNTMFGARFLCIHISGDMYLPLAERLYTDIQSMNLFDVFMNKSLKHGPFRDVFEGMLKTKPFDEFESLVLRKHENIQHFVKKTLTFKGGNQIDS